MFLDVDIERICWSCIILFFDTAGAGFLQRWSLIVADSSVSCVAYRSHLSHITSSPSNFDGALDDEVAR